MKSKNIHRQINIWNETQVEIPFDLCIHHLFENQVKKLPNKIAAECRGKRITYKELDVEANKVASFLLKQGVRPNDLIGIFSHRSIQMVIGILGVLKAGGAYVPLDPKYPADRLKFMLQDSIPKILLTEKKLLDKLFDFNGLTYALEEIRSNYESTENEPPIQSDVSSHHLAYVIYTSGSTGKPKGILLRHQGLCNLIIDSIKTL